MDVEQQTGKRKPPRPINGVEYEWLAEDKLCTECGRLVLENQLVVRRNARGKCFEEFLPLKHGICLNCGADGLSKESVRQYEKVLKQVANYETLKDKKEITEKEEKHMRLLERYIESLQEFCDELSDFVTYTEESGVAYYDDQLEDNDEQ